LELFSNKLIGLILIAGSILFLIAAFLPYSRVFMEPDPSAKLEILHQKRLQWNLGQVLFSTGAVIAALGLAFLFVKHRESVRGSWPMFGVVILLIGSLLWSWHCIERMISPEGFVNGTLTPYLFILYSILTQAGLIVFGIFLLQTGLANWTGWMLIGGIALISLLMIIFKDMPPFVYYLFTFVLAIKLLVDARQAL